MNSSLEHLVELHHRTIVYVCNYGKEELVSLFEDVL